MYNRGCTAGALNNLQGFSELWNEVEGKRTAKPDTKVLRVLMHTPVFGNGAPGERIHERSSKNDRHLTEFECLFAEAGNEHERASYSARNHVARCTGNFRRRTRKEQAASEWRWRCGALERLEAAKLETTDGASH